MSPVDNKRTTEVEAKINGQDILFVVDTGASISLVSKEKWESCFPNHLPVATGIVAECYKHTHGYTWKNFSYSSSGKQWKGA